MTEVSRHPAPVPPAFRKLTADEQARTLEKLRRLETAARFAPGWDELEGRLRAWAFDVRANLLACEDVPAIAAEMERWGVR